MPGLASATILEHIPFQIINGEINTAY